MTVQSPFKRFYIFLDHALSPPKNYITLTYRDRLRGFVTNLKAGRNSVRNLVHIARLSTMMGLSYLLWPLAYLLKKNGYRFVDIDLSQIGSALYLDLLLREDALDLQTPRHKVFILASYYEDGNRYLFDLYSHLGILVRNPFLKFLLSPFFISDVFQDNSYRYDTVYFPEAISHGIWKRYQNTYQKPLIALPAQDIDLAWKTLQPYLAKGQKFVALHVRDSGFYGDKVRTARNADILTYQKGIQYLIDQGYAVVRLGNDRADSIDEMVHACGPMLFDYAHSDIRSEMMDCFFISQCEFYVGGPSGPASVPMLFHVKSCNVNWYTFANAPNFLRGDITTCKKFFYTKDKSLVPFADLMKPPMSINPTDVLLDELGMYYENNSAEEIYESVKECVENPDNQVSELQKKAQTYLNKQNYAFGAQGHFSNVTLKDYEEEIID